ncbi:hypothetical protein BSZ19_21850 [Bradyrhizobium japonicum]|uniref:Uncharacterized protein n=1 Tax=Bradyrhizobium japonicum TaxID=375 RepID=A0A1Y2JND4_BRAJP|nr:hypothetical protein [Bradyrhizobium japonicum]OSJ31531.1 hypothetical protein BSZ19_21850 [Bradyrhizobium japonicum]
MAKKEPETTEEVKLFAVVSIAQMGPAIAALERIGVVDVGYEFITHVNHFKNKKVHEVSATDFAAEYVQANPRFTSAAIVAHFKAAGRQGSAAYYGLKKLAEANVIRKSGDEFIRVEALPAPEPKAKGQHYEVPNKGLIEGAIKGRKQFTVRELRDLFVKEGRQEKSISPILSKMASEKLIKKAGPGEYTVLAKGAKAAAEAPAPIPNGASLNGSGVAAHG